MDSTPAPITARQLLDRYDGLLVDAFGVLVHSTGAFPGAAEFIDRLNALDFPYRVVTNDSSRLPETCARKYSRDGLEIVADDVLTSGQLLEGYFADHGLQGARCLVLGTDDSETYVERAGGQLVGLDASFDVLVLGDDDGFEFRPTTNHVLTELVGRFDRDEPPSLVLPNPDRLFQRSDDTWGVAVGAIASMFESILADRYPDRRPTFDRLGKPHAPLYRTAMEQLGTDNVAMIGDQLTTDIDGANRVGMDSVMMADRLAELDRASEASGIRPDFVLESLNPEHP